MTKLHPLEEELVKQQMESLKKIVITQIEKINNTISTSKNHIERGEKRKKKILDAYDTGDMLKIRNVLSEADYYITE